MLQTSPLTVRACRAPLRLRRWLLRALDEYVVNPESEADRLALEAGIRRLWTCTDPLPRKAFEQIAALAPGWSAFGPRRTYAHATRGLGKHFDRRRIRE
jgi:hypothetical protein